MWKIERFSKTVESYYNSSDSRNSVSFFLLIINLFIKSNIGYNFFVHCEGFDINCMVLALADVLVKPQKVKLDTKYNLFKNWMVLMYKLSPGSVNYII